MAKRYKNKPLIGKIIAKIKRLRTQKGVTLQQVYVETNIHLARIESEQRDIPISTLKLICQYFGTTVSEFMKDIERS